MRIASLRRHLPLLLALLLLGALAGAPAAGAQAVPGVSDDCAFPVLVNTTELTYSCASDSESDAGANGASGATQHCSSVRGGSGVTARGVKCATARLVVNARRGRSRYRHSGFSCRTGSARRVTCRRPASDTREAARISFRARS